MPRQRVKYVLLPDEARHPRSSLMVAESVRKTPDQPLDLARSILFADASI